MAEPRQAPPLEERSPDLPTPDFFQVRFRHAFTLRLGGLQAHFVRTAEDLGELVPFAEPAFGARFCISYLP